MSRVKAGSQPRFLSQSFLPAAHPSSFVDHSPHSFFSTLPWCGANAVLPLEILFIDLWPIQYENPQMGSEEVGDRHQYGHQAGKQMKKGFSYSPNPLLFLGARSESRTRTPLRAVDFESD